MKALIIVDVQNDFCPGGSLATADGKIAAERIAHYLATNSSNYDYVITTQDWHIDPGTHFSDTPDFIDSWPTHCLANESGAALHPALKDISIDQRFFKGHFTAAYSGFEGISSPDITAENETLLDWLKSHEVSDLDIVGIATDYCVKATVLDALSHGFKVQVLTDLTAAVAEETGQSALKEMSDAGAHIN